MSSPNILLNLLAIITDEIRNGPYRNLYHPEQLINGKEDASNNFARGSFYSGSEILKIFRNKMHQLVEQTDCLESFLLFNSVGGGSGSGMAALIIQQIALDFPKATRMQMPIFSGPSMSTAIVEPYNTILHTHTTMDIIDLAILFDNEALYDMCNKLLLLNCPNYSDLNRIVALMVSSITCSLRYETAQHTSIKEIRTNLIPYPRIHFPIVRHAPLEHKSRCPYSNLTVNYITKCVFSKNYQSLKCDTSRGRYMSIILTYRGLVTPREVTEALYKQRSNLSNFVEWSPSGYKLGLNSQGPIVVPDSDVAPSDKGVTMMCNTTSIKDIWVRIGRKFDILFDKRAFLHWYVQEGMEESEFNESRHDIRMLEEDYVEISLNEKELVSNQEKQELLEPPMEEF